MAVCLKRRSSGLSRCAAVFDEFVARDKREAGCARLQRGGFVKRSFMETPCSRANPAYRPGQGEEHIEHGTRARGRW